MCWAARAPRAKPPAAGRGPRRAGGAHDGDADAAHGRTGRGGHRRLVARGAGGSIQNDGARPKKTPSSTLPQGRRRRVESTRGRRALLRGDAALAREDAEDATHAEGGPRGPARGAGPAHLPPGASFSGQRPRGGLLPRRARALAAANDDATLDKNVVSARGQVPPRRATGRSSTSCGGASATTGGTWRRRQTAPLVW